ncbi:MAG: nucleoside deaminase [Candidatus Micrarchaeota archaeon]|nr:nucleoside deaminase [Candidatus Micrarchaeota archaeon]
MPSKTQHDDEMNMRVAIRSAKLGIRKKEGGPFGACIVGPDGKVLAVAHNTVWKSCDSTAHAEVNAIRMACRKLKSIDLSGCTIYSTCEPCPMCFAAIHWARIKNIAYGATIDDASAYKFNEMRLCNADIARKCKLEGVRIKGGVLRVECLHLFEEWRKSKGKPY